MTHQESTERLLSFHALMRDWNSYGAEPPTKIAIDKALLLCALLIPPKEIIPGDGSIELEFQEELSDYIIEIEVGADAKVVMGASKEWDLDYDG